MPSYGGGNGVVLYRKAFRALTDAQEESLRRFYNGKIFLLAIDSFAKRYGKALIPSEISAAASIAESKFTDECDAIMRRYKRDLAKYRGKEKKRYLQLRRSYQIKSAPNFRMPPIGALKLNSLDVARLALIDPTLRVRNEPEKSERVASAFRILENQKRPASQRAWPEFFLAQRVFILFEKFCIPFKDYKSESHDKESAAVTVLKILLPRADSRHLIRLAQGKKR